MSVNETVMPLDINFRVNPCHPLDYNPNHVAVCVFIHIFMTQDKFAARQKAPAQVNGRGADFSSESRR